MKKPFLHASGAALYIASLVLIVQAVTAMFPTPNFSIVIPMTMLGLFVLSAAIMGYVFLSEPLYLLMENHKQEAIIFFGKTVGFFACYVIFFGILILIFR